MNPTKKGECLHSKIEKEEDGQRPNQSADSVSEKENDDDFLENASKKESDGGCCHHEENSNIAVQNI